MPDVRHGRGRAGDGGDAAGSARTGSAWRRRSEAGVPAAGAFALRSATAKEAFVEAFAKLEREGIDVPGRAAFEDAKSVEGEAESADAADEAEGGGGGDERRRRRRRRWWNGRRRTRSGRSCRLGSWRG